MKPIALADANGLQLSPAETVELFLLLNRVAEKRTTEEDRRFAYTLLLRSASLYPGYAETTRQKPLIRPTHGRGKGGRL
ncbi:hypothetical protein GCM10023189_59050 [Nibrella saemangeumensis]|uniref:Uncharacterized protein n=1 Tax=Nibrella saemangeumensis TaxID=1084526 RepID=A0ABP8NS73_9BACT